MVYRIRFSDEADEHIASLTARQRRTVLDKIERQLRNQPAAETRNRKRMQEGKAGFIAPWELRIGDLRVYYDVQVQPETVVIIVAVGLKVRNRVSIAGREYEP